MTKVPNFSLDKPYFCRHPPYVPGRTVDTRADGPLLPLEAGAVLSHLRSSREASRTDLARHFGMSRAAIESRLASLRELDLIEDAHKGTSTGGRPPTIVRFTPGAGTVVGVDLGATSLDVAVTDLDGVPLARRSVDADVRDGPDAVLTTTQALIDELLASDPQARARLVGIGVGVPGPVEFVAGRPIAPPIMPGWDQFPVGAVLRERYSVPVHVDNDVNVMAEGERWAGRGTEVDHFLWVKIGSGIGCGIVIDGHVYRGGNGCAGDIGHIDVGEHQTLCRCGNLGCLEAIAGGYALGEAALQLAQSGRSAALAETLSTTGSVSAADLRTAVEKGDRAALDLVRSAGGAIGMVLASIVSFVNPQKVFIGGGVANVGDSLLAAIREQVYRRSLPLATRDLEITASTLGADAGVIGAAALVLDQLFHLAPARGRGA